MVLLGLLGFLLLSVQKTEQVGTWVPGSFVGCFGRVYDL